MKKHALYTYLGTNGTITSPVHLEDIYYVLNYALDADEHKKLTKDYKTFFDTRIVPENEVSEWVEVDE